MKKYYKCTMTLKNYIKGVIYPKVHIDAKLLKYFNEVTVVPITNKSINEFKRQLKTINKNTYIIIATNKNYVYVNCKLIDYNDKFITIENDNVIIRLEYKNINIALSLYLRDLHLYSNSLIKI